MKIQSNLDKIVLDNSTCSLSSLNWLHFPKTGLAAAKTEVLELSLVVIPALATLIVCCYIASWIATLSIGLILSN
jgi:hypothetical protein